MGLTVSSSLSSAHTYISRLFHSPDFFTVSTLCIYWSRQPRVFRRLTSLVTFMFNKLASWTLHLLMLKDLQWMVCCLMMPSHHLHQCWLNSLRPSDTYMRQLTIIGSDNGLSPGRRQAIIWNNAVILLMGPLGMDLMNIFVQENALENVCEMASILSRPHCAKQVWDREAYFCGLYVIIVIECIPYICK